MHDESEDENDSNDDIELFKDSVEEEQKIYKKRQVFNLSEKRMGKIAGMYK